MHVEAPKIVQNRFGGEFIGHGQKSLKTPYYSLENRRMTDSEKMQREIYYVHKELRNIREALLMIASALEEKNEKEEDSKE